MSHEKLKRLKADLERCRNDADDLAPADYPSNRALVAQRVGGAPSIHGTAMRFLDRIWGEQALLSRQAIGRDPLKHQHCFDTHDAVYASVGVLHPGREVALAFSPRIETDSSLRVEASPWDTGMFYLHAAPRLGLESDGECRRVFLEHTLPAPLYREYLIDYVATCFDCGDDYLRAMPYWHEDPMRVMGTLPKEALLRVFELRVFSRLPIDLSRVEAVFLPSAKSLTGLQKRDMLPRLRRAGVAVEYYGRGTGGRREANPIPDDLRTYVMDWVCRRNRTGRPVT